MTEEEIETIRYNIILNKEEAVSAYMAQISPERGNGNYILGIPRGMFYLYGVDTRHVKVQWQQNGNYFPPENRIDEFNVTSLFDEKEILKHTDFNYSDLTDEELEESIDYDEEVVGSSTVSEIIAEDYEIDDIPARKIIYTIIWE